MKRCSENMQIFYRRTPKPNVISTKLQNIEIIDRHGSYSVNLLHIFRAPFYNRNSAGLLLPLSLILFKINT